SPLSSTNPSPTDIYTLSLHDALPILRGTLPDGSRQSLTIPLYNELDRGTVHAIYRQRSVSYRNPNCADTFWLSEALSAGDRFLRSEEHTSELQSLRHIVCRLLLEKKK